MSKRQIPAAKDEDGTGRSAADGIKNFEDFKKETASLMEKAESAKEKITANDIGDEADKTATREGIDVDLQSIRKQGEQLNSDALVLLKNFKEKMADIQTKAGVLESDLKRALIIKQFRSAAQASPKAQSNWTANKHDDVDKIVAEMDEVEISAVIDDFDAEDKEALAGLKKAGLSNREIITVFLDCREEKKKFSDCVIEKYESLP